jgi:hypothetical protein
MDVIQVTVLQQIVASVMIPAAVGPAGIGGSGGGGTPGGAASSIQYNNSGSFGGFGTYDGTNFDVGAGVLIKGQYSNRAGSAYINPDGSAVLGTNLVISNTGNISGANFNAAGLGLGNVNNTSDANKPVSTAQAAADLVVQGYAVQRANHTGLQLAATISDFSTAVDARITAQKGVALGLASLDGSGKLTSSQIPASLVGAVVYQGVWNASTNTPALASGVGTKGFYYKVSVAGATSLDGNANWNVGDTVIFDGTTWDGIDGNANEVISVFGRQGVVVAASGDYTTAQVTESGNLYLTNARVIAATLTSYTSGAGTVAATDTVLQAIQKLNGNAGLKLNAASPTYTGTMTTPLTTGSVAYIGASGALSQDNNNLFYNAGSHILSVATAGDQTGTDAINVYGEIDMYQPNSAQGAVGSAAVAGPSVSSSQGTGASPTINLTGDLLGGLQFFAYSGASPAYNAHAGIYATVAGSTANNLGGQLNFYTKADGGAMTSRMQISNDGSFALNGPVTVTSGGTIGSILPYRTQFQSNSRGSALAGFEYNTSGGTFTSATETPVVAFNINATNNYNTGSKAIQRDFRILGSTNTASAASIITVAATLGVDAPPIASTNIIQTLAAGIYVGSGNVGSSTVAGYGIYINAPTGATANWAAGFNGDIFVTGGAIKNTKINRRVVTAADATSITPNTDAADWTYQVNTQSAGTLTMNADAGTGQTANQGWGLQIYTTNAQTFAWDSSYIGTAALPLPTTLPAGDSYLTFVRSTRVNKWRYTGTAGAF